MEEPPAEPEKVEAPKKKTPPGVQVVKKAAESGGSPGAVALRALQGDFEKLVDDGVQRKYRLQLSQFENDVGDKGEDPAFVKKIEVLHEQVKTALAKQQ